MKKKRTAIIMFIALAVIAGVFAGWAILKHGQQDQSKQLISDLAFDSLTGREPADIGFRIVYESDDYIVFNNSYGLWGYDLSGRHLTFNMDLVKTFGEEARLQGEYDPYGVRIECSADGKSIVVSCADRDTSSDPEVDRNAYYLDIPTLTYQRSEYRKIENRYYEENAVGEIISGSTLIGSEYVRGDETWDLFVEYENP